MHRNNVNWNVNLLPETDNLSCLRLAKQQDHRRKVNDDFNIKIIYSKFTSKPTHKYSLGNKNNSEKKSQNLNLSGKLILILSLSDAGFKNKLCLRHHDDVIRKISGVNMVTEIIDQ